MSKTPSKTKYFRGEQVTLTAKPKYAYTFSGWGGDATGTESTVTLTSMVEKTITANFVRIPMYLGWRLRRTRPKSGCR